MTVTVGVLGATGAVGRALLRQLPALPPPGGTWRIRAAGRDPRRVADALAQAPGVVPHPEPVAATDPAALARLAAGCRIVVNAAGPSHRIGDRVARAAAAAGADYVDAAGEAELEARVATVAAPAGWRAVLGAGLTPGLTGVLPRLLLDGVDPGAALTGCAGGADRFTMAGAGDYLAAVTDPVTGSDPVSGAGAAALWRDGSRVAGAASRVDGALLPGLPRPVTLVPYLSRETERLAAAARLAEARWYTIFDGDAVLAALRQPPERSGDPVAALRTAAELDLLGRTPYQLVLLRLVGTAGGAPLRRALLLLGRGAADLTAACTAISCAQLAAGVIPPGRWPAARVLDPRLTWQALRDSPAVLRHELPDSVPEFELAAEEGVL